MYNHLLLQLNSNLLWIQASAHGAAWFGYDRDKLNQAGSVKQIIRLKNFRNSGGEWYNLEFWQSNRMSEYTLHSENYSDTLWVINDLIRRIKHG